MFRLSSAWSSSGRECNGSNNSTKQFVWGIYADELIQQKNITALNNFGTNAALYPLQDLLYRTMALADSSGVIREAYDYDAYGNTLIFRNSGSPPSAIGWSSDTQVVFPTCAFLFTGQRYDAESINYYYKMRYYSPKWGRFISTDPIGALARRLNLYELVSSRPTVWLDPTGKNPLILVPLAGAEAAYAAAAAAAAAFGLSIMACLSHAPCQQALRRAVENVINTLPTVAKMLLQAACELVYLDYKANELFCQSCDPRRGKSFCERATRCFHGTLNSACWSVVVTKRAAYIVSGCDFVLNEHFSGHVNELLNKQRALDKCAESAVNNCNPW